MLNRESELARKINENLVKFQNDVKPIQLMDRMNEIFKEPHIPEHYSSSSTESDDDNDDVHNGSELGYDNQRSYGSYSDSSDEDYIRMVRQAQEEERNDPHYTDDHNDEECVSDPEDEGRKMITKKVVKKDAKEEGSSKKMKVIVLKKKGGERKRQQIKKTDDKENDIFDDLNFVKHLLENEHLYFQSQPSTQKMKDVSDEAEFEDFFDNKEEYIKRGLAEADEKRKAQEELERKKALKKRSQKEHLYRAICFQQHC
ncbi:hypothetical protein Tco_1447468 [Tanacetum coccineum]